MSYLSLTIAGGATFTPMNVALGMSIAVRVVATFLIIGSIVGLFGYMKRQNHIEILGYPLLVMGMGSLSVSVFFGGMNQEPRTVIGMLLLSFTAKLVARYHDLQALSRFTTETSTKA